MSSFILQTDPLVWLDAFDLTYLMEEGAFMRSDLMEGIDWSCTDKALREAEAINNAWLVFSARVNGCFQYKKLERVHHSDFYDRWVFSDHFQQRCNLLKDTYLIGQVFYDAAELVLNDLNPTKTKGDKLNG